MKIEQSFPKNAPWHGVGCECGAPTCKPTSPADRRPGALQTGSLIAIAGFVTALVMIEIYAAIAHVPGVEVIFQ